MEKSDLFKEAVSLQVEGRSREAIDRLRLITHTDPHYYKAFSLLGQIAAQSGDSEEAWECLRHLDAVGPNTQAIADLMAAMDLVRASRNPHRRPVPDGYYQAQVTAKEVATGAYLEEMNARRDLKLRIRRVRDGFLAETSQIQFTGRSFAGEPVVGESVALPFQPPKTKRNAPERQMLNLDTGAWLEVDDRPDNVHKTQESAIRTEKIVGFTLLSLLLAGACYLAYDSWIYPHLNATVPNVAGQDPVNAIVTLRTAGFNNTQTRLVKDGTAAGNAVGTDPSAGLSAAHQDTIVILIGDPLGPPGTLTEMPDVVGLNWETAMSRLSRQSLLSVELQGDRGGTVLRTEPTAGTSIRPSRPGDNGDTVVLIMG